jgi:hypothetical protein
MVHQTARDLQFSFANCAGVGHEGETVEEETLLEIYRRVLEWVQHSAEPQPVVSGVPVEITVSVKKAVQANHGPDEIKPGPDEANEANHNPEEVKFRRGRLGPRLTGGGAPIPRRRLADRDRRLRRQGKMGPRAQG